MVKCVGLMFESIELQQQSSVNIFRISDFENIVTRVVNKGRSKFRGKYCQPNYNRASVCLYVCICSCFPPRRLAPRGPHFQGLIYDPTNETKRLYFFEIPRISRANNRRNHARARCEYFDT